MTEDTAAMTPTSGANSTVEDAVANAVAAHRDEAGPLISVLRAVQAELGWLPPGATPLLAEALNLSRADVHGVITFYADFRDRPPARRVLRICRAEACQSVGGRELARRAVERLGIGFGETTDDGEVGLEQVFCLGNCALGPAAELDGRLHGRVDAAHLDRLLADDPEKAGTP